MEPPAKEMDPFEQFRETLCVIDSRIKRAADYRSVEDMTQALDSRIEHIERKKMAVGTAIRTLEARDLVNLPIYRMARNEQCYLNELLIQSYAMRHNAPGLQYPAKTEKKYQMH